MFQAHVCKPNGEGHDSAQSKEEEKGVDLEGSTTGNRYKALRIDPPATIFDLVPTISAASSEDSLGNGLSSVEAAAKPIRVHLTAQRGQNRNTRNRASGWDYTSRVALPAQ